MRLADAYPGKLVLGMELRDKVRWGPGCAVAWRQHHLALDLLARDIYQTVVVCSCKTRLACSHSACLGGARTVASC